MIRRVRADRLLVERGLFESRSMAQAAIEDGLVTANAVPVRKASQEISIDAVLDSTPAYPWVSRGGVKLAAALDHFAVPVKGRICLDVGASTGGFTDVLLAGGASRVCAVDVGRDQLHPRLRADPRVSSLEQTDIRALTADRLSPAPDLIVIDVSFISLTLVLPAALALAAPRTDLLALIKPQFEAGRAHVRKGIVRDEAVYHQVCDTVTGAIAALGWTVLGVTPSAILGRDGNREFFVAAHLN